MNWGMIKDFIREVEIQENHYKLESTLCKPRNLLQTLNRLDTAEKRQKSGTSQWRWSLRNTHRKGEEKEECHRA